MTVIAYCLYLLLALGLTIWVARTLSTNGKVYLVRSFDQDEELATSVNHLLVVGFYLVNFGFIALALSTAGEVFSVPEMMRFLGWYVGIAVLVLGGMHFFNMSAITRNGRKVAKWMHDHVPPPERRAARVVE
jgi:drug/metabolite transporter (DMT)-like permease